MSTTSGCVARHCSTACAPSAASPTTSMSGSAAIRRSRPVAHDAVVVGDQHADHRLGHLHLDDRPASRVRRRRAAARRRARRHPSSRVRPRCPSPSRRSRSAGVNPRPSSLTVSWTPPACDATTATRTAPRPRVCLRVAQRLARDAVDELVVRVRRDSGATCSSVVTPLASSGLSRSLSAASSPADARFGGWISTSSVRRSRTPWRRRSMAARSTPALVRVAAAVGLLRPAARARRRRRRGPGRRRRGDRPRSGAAHASRPRRPARAAPRARGARAAAAAPSTTPAGPGRAAARARPASSGGASAWSRRSPLALTELKRW